jgi:hypothetical protein
MKDDDEPKFTQEQADAIGKYLMIFQILWLVVVLFVWYTGGFEEGNYYFQGFGKIINKFKDILL